MEERKDKTLKTLLLVLNGILAAIGTCGSPLVMRLYFLHGGARIWLLSWLQTAGFPIIIIPLVIAYAQRRATKGSNAKLFYMKPFLFVSSGFIGVLIGLNNYLYTYGLSRLPVSTSSLIISSQLAFTAVFSFLLVKQKFTFYSINAVLLLCVGAGMLALHTSGDRPEGETDKEYITGFLMTVGAAALYGLLLPLIELMYKKSKQVITYTLVLEIQFVFFLLATGFCTVGMLINKDFQAMSREAKNYTIGEVKYYLVLVGNAIFGQFFFLGAIGIIFCASSLLSGIVVVALLPVTEILAVLFFKETFKAEKGVSFALSLWGFISYYVGEYKKNKKPQPPLETEMNRSSLP